VPHPLDEYPIHQSPLSAAQVATSDRNAYDRYYFNAHDRTGDRYVILGLGVYPNLGTADAFATFRHGLDQVTVRASDVLEDLDRLAPAVGPISVEVLDPLNELAVTVDAPEHGLTAALRWRALFPAVDEQPHRWRGAGDRLTLDAQRFAQLGTWEGELVLDGVRHEVDPGRWIGSRDRSWGIRPSGAPEPPERAAAEPIEGFWWLYVPVAFDDFAIVCIVQEEPDGHRVVNDAVRVWPAEAGRRPEQLGWPRVAVRYRPGTRDPLGATIELTERDGTPLVLEVESLGSIALNAGPGYGGDHTGWSHGAWRGRGWSERVDLRTNDPAVAAMAAFSVVDHVGRARLGNREGWGLFEHGTFGRHDPSGFAGWDDVAPG